MNPIHPNDPETSSLNVIQANIEQLKILFPEIVCEGKIDFDVLRELLGNEVEGQSEKYGFTWHGKRLARKVALTPSTGTLRPARDESVEWDRTQNLMIEGDNLEVLKLLQKSYAGRVKLIYIDPPYNTGNDFVYPDNYEYPIKNYLEITNQVEGHNRISSNTESGGRFHTKWLNMMYPRLQLARSLLREDGLIFVSIDDRELSSLKFILDEIFGDENFEGHIHWRRRHNQPNDPTKMLALVAEHILCYARDKNAYKLSGVGKIALTGRFSNPDNDPRGNWSTKPWKAGSDQTGSRYQIITPAGISLDEEWMGEQATYESLLSDNRIIFPENGHGFPRKKYFETERQMEGQSATNWWPHEQFGHNQAANSLLTNLLGEKNVFSNPKPIELLKGILDVANVKNIDIVLDFFAGSGTTGHAVMEQNLADNGQRRYILVQIPESIDATNKEQKTAADFCQQLGISPTIAELTKERLRRAGAKIKHENPILAGDIGFRVFKLDSSNIHTWDGHASDIGQLLLENIDHVKSDRSDMDVLYEILLKFGLDLSVPIQSKVIEDYQVYAIGAGVLMVCLTRLIDRHSIESLTTGIAQWHEELNPVGDRTIIFRDSAFVDDIAKTNLTAILHQQGFTHVRSI